MSTADVDRIVGEPDRPLRNLQITVAYAWMAEDFRHRVDATNLPWCGFGTWASEGVGAAIRHHHSDRKPVLKAMKVAMPGRFRVLARIAAQAFAVGNRSVFDHIGRGFAEFHEAIDEGRVEAHLEEVRATSPCEPVPLGADVTEPLALGLADGFAHYAEAKDTEDPVRRAQLIAAGNLTLAYVEQLRLQRPIQRAFRSPLPRELGDSRRARRVAARFFTETAMELQLGDQRFRPSRRLPPHESGHHWPSDLEVPLDELFDGLEPFLVEGRRAPDSKNWTDLTDRLRYIAALMRSRQQTAELFRAPFDPDECEQIWGGAIPRRLTPKVLR